MVVGLATVTGCRVADSRATVDLDAGIVGGDNGLPARVIVDAWIWATPNRSDSSGADALDAGASDARDAPAPVDSTEDTEDTADTAGVACALLDPSTCPVNLGCYADEALSGGAICRAASPGYGVGTRFPCQLQNDCSPGEVCIELKGNGKVCLALCLSGATCLDLGSTTCVPLPAYPGLGYCM